MSCETRVKNSLVGPRPTPFSPKNLTVRQT
jgi:hypothetical protein